MLQVGSQAGEAPTYSLEALRTRETTQALHAKSESMAADLLDQIKEAKKVDDDDTEDEAKERLELVRYVGQQLKAVMKDTSVIDGKRLEINSYAERILQTVEEPVESAYLPKAGKLFRNLLVGAIVGQRAPGISDRKKMQPMGEKRANRESAYLFDRHRGVFYSYEELSLMSPLEVAELDISPTHPIWQSRTEFADKGEHAVASFEAEMIRGITAALKEEGVLGSGETYRPHLARRVLFLDEVYRSATSAKAKAEDGFGMEWKLKWGDETAVEPVSSRLYLNAGGRMTDLTFSGGSGPSDLILVLRDPSKSEDDDEDERHSATLDELVTAIDDFYGFDLNPYIHSSGQITSENVESLLRNLPKGSKKKYLKNQMIGRHWVAFRECGLELKPGDSILRYDGARTSDLVAAHDRATRGLYVFNMWISNPDAKDGNSKSFFIREPTSSGLEIVGYREGQHDMGLSLGSLWASGHVNRFDTGKQFAHRGLFGAIRFRQPLLFRSEAWDAMTWSDGRWMAQCLADISETQIRDSVAASGWPDFMQEALVYKLRDRQLRLSTLYGIEVSDDAIQPPNLSISLGTAAEIRSAEEKYSLPPGSLQAEVEESLSFARHPNYRENLIVEGQVVPCEKSALIRVLTRQRYPSGLSDRYERFLKTGPKCLD